MFGTRVEELHDHLVLAISGDVDLAAAPDLRSRIQRGLDDGFDRMIVDLTEVELVDSVGLGILLGGLRRTRAVGGDLHLVVPERLHRVFTACDLDRVFTLHARVADIIGMGSPT